MNSYIQHIEAIIFASAQPVSIGELQDALQKVFNLDEPLQELESLLNQLKEKYASDNFSFELVISGGGYQFLTKPNYHETVSIFLNQKDNKRLSAAALETLSIIAYKQPVTKSEIEQIRGVNSDYTVHKLLEKELITIIGKAETPGKPVIYGVSEYFLDYFGINSPNELPQLKEIVPKEENSIGEGE
jgi:segregation and condensation protein B